MQRGRWRRTSSLATRAPGLTVVLGRTPQLLDLLTTCPGQYTTIWTTMLLAGARQRTLTAARSRPVQARVRQARVSCRAPRGLTTPRKAHAGLPPHFVQPRPGSRAQWGCRARGRTRARGRWRTQQAHRYLLTGRAGPAPRPRGGAGEQPAGGLQQRRPGPLPQRGRAHGPAAGAGWGGGAADWAPSAARTATPPPTRASAPALRGGGAGNQSAGGLQGRRPGPRPSAGERTSRLRGRRGGRCRLGQAGFVPRPHALAVPRWPSMVASGPPVWGQRQASPRIGPGRGHDALGTHTP